MTAEHRRSLAGRLIAATIDAVHAGRLLDAAIAAGVLADLDRATAPVVVAAGKAAGSMAQRMLDWCGGHVRDGVVASPHVEARALVPLRAYEAGHPHPTDRSVAAAVDALSTVRGLTARDQVVVLLSGGASALFALPAPPVTLADKAAVTRRLLTHGVAIDGLNAVRKHLSLVKGGQFAVSTPASLWTLALSDVSRPFDDDPATIGSGPTVADPTSFAEACDVLDTTGADWRAQFPRVAGRLDAGRRGEIPETPKPGSRDLARSRFHVIGGRQTAARAAASAAKAAGLDTVIIDPPVQGEARSAAVAFLDEALAHVARLGRPCCVVATGETTVTVEGTGLGGRNQEFVLAAILELARRGVEATVASAGTDGVDGPTDAAGAVADERTLPRAAQLGLDPASYLAENNSYRFFDPLGGLVKVAATDTNVGDLMLLLID